METICCSIASFKFNILGVFHVLKTSVGLLYLWDVNLLIPHGDNNHLHFLGLGKFGPLIFHHFIGN
jgi:hypothetical protein